jgi:probable rRNA maturation factor
LNEPPRRRRLKRRGPADGVVTVFVSDEQAALPIEVEKWQQLALAVLVDEGVEGEAELSVMFVDEETIGDLNKRFMEVDGPTDVLSFPIDELRSADPDVEPEPGVLGDIVLCPAFLTDQMQQSGRSLDHELAFLVVHGTLHLIGYDHMDDHELTAMFALQDQLLDEWLSR